MTLYEFAINHSGRVITVVYNNVVCFATIEGIDLANDLETSSKSFANFTVLIFENTEKGLTVYIG